MENCVTVRSENLPVVDGPSMKKCFDDRCVKDGDVEILHCRPILDGRLPGFASYRRANDRDYPTTNSP